MGAEYFRCLMQAFTGGDEMKKLFIIGILVAFLFIAIPAMAVVSNVYNLTANQNVRVGSVIVCNTSSNLYVFYELNEGWYMNDSHADAETSLALIPQTKGTPIPGHFKYSTVYNYPENWHYYTIPWSTPALAYIAAQADVYHKTGGVIDGNGGAWASRLPGNLPFLKKNWATYITYTPNPAYYCD
jgi:hypothetical protein